MSMIDSAAIESGRRRGAGLLAGVTGVAVAFGLSTCGILVGALLAAALERVELLPDGWWPFGWVVLAALGTIAAGVTVRSVAGRLAPWSVALAGILVFFGLHEILRTIEATGAEGPEVPVSLGMAVAFVGLLGTGVALGRRREPGRAARQ